MEVASRHEAENWEKEKKWKRATSRDQCPGLTLSDCSSAQGAQGFYKTLLVWVSVSVSV